MLHGVPDTAHTWDYLRPELAKRGFRAVSPFMRGYSPTDVPDSPIDARVLGEDAVALVKALGEREAILIGHDWGAVAAYAAVSLNPEVFKHVVVCAVPHPSAQKPSLGLMWYARHFLVLNLPGAAQRLRKNDFAYLKTLYKRWSPTWDVQDEDLVDIKRSLSEPGSAEAAVSYYHMLRSGKPDPLFKTRIQVPATAIAGADEPEITPEMFESARKCFERGYEVRSIPGGHFAHRESPAEFADIVARTLRVG